MPTTNERKALWFLALVAVSGAGVRLVRGITPPPSSAEVDALDRQLGRVDSARASRSQRADKSDRGARKGTRSRRADADSAGPRNPSPAAPPASASPIDLDRATAKEIETLPGIGPALARRIVATRDSAGSFGSIDALCEVRGVGAKLAERLRPLVTFTGPRRPLIDACGAPVRAARKRRGS